MIKNLIFVLIVCISTFSNSEITEITEIDNVRLHFQEPNVLYLFDIDETLITNPYNLGGHAWRKWVKARIKKTTHDFNLYDELSLHLAKTLPYKTVEEKTASLISDLQTKHIPVFALTARVRLKSYSSKIVDLDHLTELQLKNVKIDFSQTKVPSEVEMLDTDYFYKGVIFTGDEKKGKLLKQFLNDLGFTPACIVFVDDKWSKVKSVESAAKEMGIPFHGYWYTRMDKEGKEFNPLVAAIQLEHLVLNNEVLSNEDAKTAAQDMLKTDPEIYFNKLMEQIEMFFLESYTIFEKH